MGWNSLQKTSGWMAGDFKDQYLYFVHSYYVPINMHTTAVCDYIQPFSAALQKDNFYAVQFHPEKSAEVGEKVLLRFLNS
jgi:Glutamine amidotransferase